MTFKDREPIFTHVLLKTDGEATVIYDRIKDFDERKSSMMASQLVFMILRLHPASGERMAWVEILKPSQSDAKERLHFNFDEPQIAKWQREHH